MPVTEIALIITSLGGFGGFAALITSVRQRHTNAKLEATQATIKREVKNNHSTNLRDDIDAIKSSVTDLSRSTQTSFAELRGDIQDERRERRMDEEAHRETHAALWKAITQP